MFVEYYEKNWWTLHSVVLDKSHIYASNHILVAVSVGVLYMFASVGYFYIFISLNLYLQAGKEKLQPTSDRYIWQTNNDWALKFIPATVNPIVHQCARAFSSSSSNKRVMAELRSQGVAWFGRKWQVGQYDNFQRSEFGILSCWKLLNAHIHQNFSEQTSSSMGYQTPGTSISPILYAF